MKLEFLIKKYLSNTSDESVLTEIQNMYSKINIYDQRLNYYLFRRRIASDRIPFQIAKRIMADCKKFLRLLQSLRKDLVRLMQMNSSNLWEKLQKRISGLNNV